MMELEYLVQVEQRYREDVLFPKLGRKAALLRELELQNQKHGGTLKRRPVRWVGDRLVGLGDLMVAAGKRLAAGLTGLTTPHSE